MSLPASSGPATGLALVERPAYHAAQASARMYHHARVSSGRKVSRQYRDARRAVWLRTDGATSMRGLRLAVTPVSDWTSDGNHRVSSDRDNSVSARPRRLGRNGDEPAGSSHVPDRGPPTVPVLYLSRRTPAPHSDFHCLKESVQFGDVNSSGPTGSIFFLCALVATIPTWRGTTSLFGQPFFRRRSKNLIAAAAVGRPCRHPIWSPSGKSLSIYDRWSGRRRSVQTHPTLHGNAIPLQGPLLLGPPTERGRNHASCPT